MKRITVLIILCLSFSILFSQSVQRTVVGFTMGMTKNTAISQINKKGFHYIEDKLDFSNLSQIKIYEAFEFGGIKWDYSILNFYKGKLCNISLHKNCKGNYTEGRNLAKAIKTKYNNVVFTTMMFNGVDYYISGNDGKTSVSVNYDRGGYNDNEIYIAYSDISTHKCYIDELFNPSLKNIDEL